MAGGKVETVAARAIGREAAYFQNERPECRLSRENKIALGINHLAVAACRMTNLSTHAGSFSSRGTPRGLFGNSGAITRHSKSVTAHADPESENHRPGNPVMGSRPGKLRYVCPCEVAGAGKGKLKMRWIKDVVINAALAFPPVRALQNRKASSTGANATVDPDGVMLEWAEKIRTAVHGAGSKIRDSDFVEIGPGHSLGVALCLLLEGARSAHALDVERRCDVTDTTQFLSLFARWKSKKNLLRDEVSLPQVLQQLRFDLLKPNGSWPFADSSQDFVYSYFAGEHLRNPQQTIAETYRTLRAGGLSLYAIDLRNHLDHGGEWLSHLYHSDSAWDAMVSRRGAWTNRLLANEWRTLFEKYFEIVDYEVRAPPPPSGFDARRLAKRFRQYDLSELLIDYVWIVARKRNSIRGPIP